MCSARGLPVTVPTSSFRACPLRTSPSPCCIPRPSMLPLPLPPTPSPAPPAPAPCSFSFLIKTSALGQNLTSIVYCLVYKYLRMTQILKSKACPQISSTCFLPKGILILTEEGLQGSGSASPPEAEWACLPDPCLGQFMAGLTKCKSQRSFAPFETAKGKNDV